MKTEDVELNVKEIFDKKKVEYSPYDVAEMRYLCRQFVEYVLNSQKRQSK